jgi:hypothetical protein
MDDASLVCFRECSSDLLSHAECLSEWKRSRLQAVPECLTLDVLHGDERLAVDFTDLVDVAEKRMIDRGGRERLSAKALVRGIVLGDIRGEKLQRDPSLERRIVGQVDDPHAAFTEFTLDGITTLQGCVQTGDGVGHECTPGSDRAQHAMR